jgi:hypothetical protein
MGGIRLDLPTVLAAAFIISLIAFTTIISF